MIRKNIPNFFTCLNLLCGCVGIVFAVQGHFSGSFAIASFMVFAASIFDFIDGFAARMLKVHSQIGKQLDSLADMVSFGVLPGMIMFRFFLETGHIEPWSLFPFFAFLVPVFSAIRLAKFNIDTRQSDSFIGLPTPANAIFISSFPLLIEQYNLVVQTGAAFSSFGEEIFYLLIGNIFFLAALCVILSLLLVSPLRLFALKFKNFSWTDNKVRYIFLVLSAALLIIFQFVGIPLVVILYIILSLVNNILNRKTPSV